MGKSVAVLYRQAAVKSNALMNIGCVFITIFLIFSYTSCAAPANPEIARILDLEARTTEQSGWLVGVEKSLLAKQRSVDEPLRQEFQDRISDIRRSYMAVNQLNPLVLSAMDEERRVQALRFAEIVVMAMAQYALVPVQ